jgi:hypothetical protein
LAAAPWTAGLQEKSLNLRFPYTGQRDVEEWSVQINDELPGMLEVRTKVLEGPSVW